MPPAGLRADTRGFTLVEIIVVMLLISIIATFTFLFIVTGVSGFVTSRENAVLAQKSALALQRITSEFATELFQVVTVSPVDKEDKTYVKYQYRRSPAAYRHIALVGAGARKSVVLVDRDTPVPGTGDPQVLIDNVSAFSMKLKKSDNTNWLLADGTRQLARVVVALTVFVNEVETRTATFTATVCPADAQEVIR